MNHPDVFRDPPRDPELAAVLREVDAAAPDRLDAGRLRAAVLARAEPALAARRQQARWWEHAARWARPAIPLALAASLALAYLVGNTTLPTGSAPETTAASLPHLEDVLSSELPDAEYRVMVSSEGETEALLRLALQEI